MPGGLPIGSTGSIKVYSENCVKTARPALVLHHRKYGNDNFYATIEDDQAALLTRSLIGTHNLMWGSDYPHTDSTWPCSNEVLDELFDDIDSETRRKITRDNVRHLYGLS